MSDVPAGLTDFLNQPDQTVSQSAPLKTTNPPPPGMADFVSDELSNEIHSSPLETAKGSIENLERAATFGVSDLANKFMYEHGVPGAENPQDVAARKQALSPALSVITGTLGGAATLATTGLSSGIAGAAESLLGSGIGSAAAAGAVEGAGLGAGNAVSDYALGDGDLNAQGIISNIGLGALFGIGAGAVGHRIGEIAGAFGKSGYVKGSIPDVISNEAVNANKEAAISGAVENLKSSANEIAESAKFLKAPLMEGQVTADPWVQKAEDALVNGAPTYSGIKKAKLYQEGYDLANKAIQDTLPLNNIDKNDLGSVLQDSMANKIENEYAPLKESYNIIKETTPQVPLKEGSAPAIARNIRQFISDEKLGSYSPATKLANDVANEIAEPGFLENVEDLRKYQANLGKRISPTASPDEKRIISMVTDKLDDWEKRAISTHANDLISKVNLNDPEEAAIWGNKIERLKQLLPQIDQVDAKYAPFRQKLSDLSSWLGKGKIGGPKDAIDFIKNRLEPEDLVNKLTQKKYQSMYPFLQKNFPEEAAILKQYQKSLMRDAATKDGVFNAKSFFTKFDNIDSGIQKHIFSSEDLIAIKHARTYLESIPKKFNPSGTAGLSAFRSFFDSPMGAAAANARDFGIDAYIKTMGSLPENYRPNPIEIGGELANKYNALNGVQKVADRSAKDISDNIRAVLGLGGKLAIPAAVSIGNSYKEKENRINEIISNPETMFANIEQHTQGISQHLPNVSQGISTSLARSLNYLAQALPKPATKLSLSQKFEPSISQKQKFDRIYETVNNPISVFPDIKSGKLTMDQVNAIQTTAPQLYNFIKKQMIDIASPDIARKLPYKTKQSIAMFLGEPLDQSMLPQVRFNNQAILNQSKAQQQQMQMPKQRSGAAQAKHLGLSNRIATQTNQGLDKDE